MTTLKNLRLLGERDARAGKSINAFFDLPPAGRYRHNENARAEYEMGYRAAKEEMRREMRGGEFKRVHWLEAAPKDADERRLYFVSLITMMAYRFTENQMQDLVRRALNLGKEEPNAP